LIWFWGAGRGRSGCFGAADQHEPRSRLEGGAHIIKSNEILVVDVLMVCFTIQLLQEMDALREFHEASMQAMAGSFKREMERQLEKEAQTITKKDDLINKQKDELHFMRGLIVSYIYFTYNCNTPKIC
jgi:nucleosome binding factor SPN SPT16 subunit